MKKEKLYSNKVALKTMWFVFILLIPSAFVCSIGFIIDDARMIALGTGAMLIAGAMALFVMFNTEKNLGVLE